MKRKLSLSIILALLISLCLAGCGGKGKAQEIAGYYKCTRISENGEEYEEYTRMTEYGIYMYLVLNEDGTGYMLNMGEKEELTWDDKEIGAGASSIPYTWQDGILTLEDTIGKAVYTKLAGDELADFMENGAPDWKSLLEEMYTGAAGDGAAGSSGGASAASWGDWSVALPEGFELQGGDFLDEEDTRYFSVKRSDFSYFDFKADGEEMIMSNYNYNKDTYTNEQVDVSDSFGGNAWTGFQYSDGFGGYGFEAYTTIDGEMIRVSSAGFAFDEAVVSEVLGSLKHVASGDSAVADTESGESEEEAAVYSGAGETWDTGAFSVFIPEGWLAIPEEKFSDEEWVPDPARLSVVKGAENEGDTWGRCNIMFNLTDDPDYPEAEAFLYDSYEEIEPLTFGNLTWRGIDGQYDSETRLMTIITGLDGEYLAASIWYERDGDRISIQDADVRAIMESIGNGGTAASGGSGTDRKEAKDTPKDTPKDTSKGSHKDAGYYEIVSYEEDGESYHRTVLEEYGITFDMMLYDDGTGYAHFMGDYYDLTWKDGTIYVETDEGTETLTYTTAYLGRNHIYIEDDISRMTFEYAGETDR